MSELAPKIRRVDPRDPVDARHPDFDWELLYERLGEQPPEGQIDKRFEELLIRLLQMLVPGSRYRIHPNSVGIRLIALAWLLSPGYFGGTPSLRRLARRCGVSPVSLARHTGFYSRLIRWRNRAQRHAWNWQKGQRSK